MPTTPSYDLLAGAGEVVPTRLGNAVVDKLTEAIIEGHLRPGDALPSEGRIAQAFGISKQIAREAVRELAAIGVVRISQGKVARVQLPDPEPIGRLFRFAVLRSRQGLAEAVEMRRIIEPAIARLAATRWQPGEDDRLRAALDRLDAAMEDIPAWIAADLDFHQTIADLSRNRLLRLQLHGLRPVIREVMDLFNARDLRPRGEWQNTFDRHKVVVDALLDRDAAGAESAMAHHFEAADGAIREIFPDSDERPVGAPA